MTTEYEVTWENRPSQPGDHDAEITVLLKQDGANVADILPQLFADSVHGTEEQQSVTDLIATLHDTERNQLLAQV
ncbi:hypothetical protein C464_13015 [Halorubrum coriense DSM 10284]|uniref:Uncharacterized protein n=1 Tax=Halorubrum coriense DSM 10284 TaxID=1227466 RepID=M0EA01_9EURY|nr:hypothetical protein C464_13015 [Halorubrum coriense DSM 10284]